MSYLLAILWLIDRLLICQRSLLLLVNQGVLNIAGQHDVCAYSAIDGSSHLFPHFRRNQRMTKKENSPNAHITRKAISKGKEAPKILVHRAEAMIAINTATINTGTAKGWSRRNEGSILGLDISEIIAVMSMKVVIFSSSYSRVFNAVCSVKKRWLCCDI